jgi:microcystin-dependent protein
VASGISGAKIGTGTLPGAAIVSGGITQTQMAANSVGAAQIIDGSVGTAEIADGSVTPAKLASASGVPTAMILPYAGPTAPAGFLLCDGSAVSRSTYSTLYGIIGTTYGVGDGSTTFNIPDIRGREIVGMGSHADVNALGKNDGITLANRRPRHAHTVTDPGHSHGSTQFITTSGGTNAAYGTGGGSAHDMLIPGNTTGISVGAAGMTDSAAYIVLNFVIKT